MALVLYNTSMSDYVLRWLLAAQHGMSGERTGGDGDGVGPVCVAEVEGIIRAQIIRSYLEDAGIPAHLAGEAVAGVYGLLQGPLSLVRVYVPSALADDARELLADLDLGNESEG
ncbi:putative signal transducing protein [Roseiflexus sp.]|uniref:putative signal transducing protein n=1 Tax=Roseiflexus sp. TaxID=2562120 RepID=UPI00398AFB60